MTVLNDEQVMLRDMAAEWVADRAPVSAFRERAEHGGGHDAALWAEMAQMGWTGVIVPEAYGGADFGYLSLGLVVEQLGRTLVASPLLSTATGGVTALRHGAAPAIQDDWLPRVVAGDAVIALAIDEAAAHDPLYPLARLSADGNGWRLSGVKAPVLDGRAADLLVVSARDPDEQARLVLVDPTADGVRVTPLDRIDGRDAAAIALDGVAVDGGMVLDGGADLIERVLDCGRAMLSAEMLGTATQAFETTLDYLRTREQFGQLIGSFQALQHRAVAMQAELVMTRSAVVAALAALDAQADDAAVLVSLAKAMAGDTLRLVAREMVQMHGGIGMTEEHDAGLYFKRAAVADATWGNAAYHRNRFARLEGY